MFLEKIVEAKMEEIARLKRKKLSLKASFQKNRMGLIAEIKKASPSKGVIAKTFDPYNQLNAYISGKVDAISVVTDERYFQGSTEILRKLRQNTSLPILRKDFIIDPIQVYESLFLGADIILLIACILSRREIISLLALAKELGLEAIVEIHSREDLDKVLDTEAEILGINNRDLNTFTVDLRNTGIMIEELERRGKRKEFYIISESGIKERADVKYLEDLGVDGVLIGEAIMTADDPTSKIKELFPE
ncbi:MAG TPA: indole-3-glycerol phosphate synthase TrpC [Fervidobacterium sp.]|nr:indole-3-glycerol phosphate synthase TrpC [Fervidobacterium sp.]HQE48798.1 indole-3-glycerol phosphate synthase TrpC [Fervidobacterium sp.]HUM41693.1 indole-3-glycerol phosphate synthase TrpC [Fervidobacterium sp.]